MKQEFRKIGESYEKTKEQVYDHEKEINELKKFLDIINGQVHKIGAAGFGNANDESINNKINSIRTDLMSKI